MALYHIFGSPSDTKPPFFFFFFLISTKKLGRLLSGAPRKKISKPHGNSPGTFDWRESLGSPSRDPWLHPLFCPVSRFSPLSTRDFVSGPYPAQPSPGPLLLPVPTPLVFFGLPRFRGAIEHSGGHVGAFSYGRSRRFIGPCWGAGFKRGRGGKVPGKMMRDE